MRTLVTVKFYDSKYVVFYDGRVVEIIYLHKIEREEADFRLTKIINDWVGESWEMWKMEHIDVFQVVTKDQADS